jgi:DNA-binding transcriptional LysR family regulator
MSLDLTTLQCFLAVAETGSFTKAAARVGRTQSAISQQIAKLERTMGKPLLFRGRNLILTSDGEILKKYAEKIFSLQHEAMDRFKAPDLEGEVHFGIPEDFANIYLSEVLVDFVRIHPRILLNIECDLTLNLFDRFKRKEFDLVLVKMNRPNDFPNGLDVWTEPLQWVGSERLIEPNKPVPLVLSPKPCVYHKSAYNALEEAGRSWRHVISSTSYTVTVAAVKAEMGITVLPYTMVPKGLDRIDGKLLPPLDDLHVSLIKHRSDNPAINSFENFVFKKLRH